ncbi:excisionase family DNA-binding protein [Actimicrobium sp. CCC2.4]|uniref:excisionase family DNA-binding protein n=1 Tax=Actimicrobium sp. CCC2.4 TaxID=3048606 RepID=UPI002AC9A834|nr:excisionase family DNA-binding protein [Actimicrobium sp. CCC2.4]MEB0136592.1 excisionase family DNA-binding protein [Actimicrobium sp. CCC2.4]WPX31722.1 excisionase family DNA-binding protein [Actimicrobium sp. CCC2.4]
MPATEVCTTRHAAKILGISVTSVQQLVETGALTAWKTTGGHRRIPLNAVHAYKLSRATNGDTADELPAQTAKTSILIIQDGQQKRDFYEDQIASWNLNASMAFCSNGYQALMEITRSKPDILLADMPMDKAAGQELINTILTYPDLSDMHMAVVSNIEQESPASWAGLSDGVVFFSNPVNLDELRGYLRGCCAGQERVRRTAGRG